MTNSASNRADSAAVPARRVRCTRRTDPSSKRPALTLSFHTPGRTSTFEPPLAIDYAARINSMPKLVASTSMHEPLEWNATLIHGDIAEAVTKLRRDDGGDILMYGSPTLMRTLAAHDLVDEYKLWIHPIILGGGKRLFADGFDKLPRLALPRHPRVRSAWARRHPDNGVVHLVVLRSRCRLSSTRVSLPSLRR